MDSMSKMNEEDLFGLNLGLFDDDFDLDLGLEPLPDFFGDDEDLADIDALIQSFEEAESLESLSLETDSQNLLIPMNAAPSLEAQSSNIINDNSNHIISSSVNSSNSNRIEVKIKTKGNQLKPENIIVKKQNMKKRKGISLLAKPSKVRKRFSNNKGKTISPSRFAYFYQDHNYCLINLTPDRFSSLRIQNLTLYSKTPQCRQMAKVTPRIRSSNTDDNQTSTDTQFKSRNCNPCLGMNVEQVDNMLFQTK